ncbi:MAG: TerC/Alx family metal homeostasis membrane protein [Candidatus Methanomethylophilaceae archaeon]|nr:TerC/Alx family metal homeostasis membrane protein [Candidatus Methanomethylophilaceae archaeon]
MDDELLAWIVFIVMAVSLVILDIVLHRKPEHIPVKKALKETAIWVVAALCFGVFIFFMFGETRGMEFITAYIMEESMSIDNLFVFILIFGLFSIPDEYQHKALFYGIFGAVIFRLIFMLIGVRLMEFDFVMYIFGIILAYAALKTLFAKESDDEGGNSKIADFMSKHLKTSPRLDGDRFFTRVDSRLMMTPLLLCVIVIEISDLVFALDSIPAVLALSSDLLVIYTSNIFAILGLRSLYFAIKGGLNSMKYLKYGLGVILMFIAAKLLLNEVIEIPIAASLGFIVAVLSVTIIASLMAKDRPQPE